jgi:hypothetical protein
VAWWGVFGVEVAALLALTIQRSVARRRGEMAWLLAAAGPVVARAEDAGRERRAAHPEWPLPDPVARERIVRLTFAMGVLLAVPGFAAVAASGADWAFAFAVYVGVTFVGTDVALLAAIVYALWRGWLEPPEDDDDGRRAHFFRLWG